MPNYRRWRQEGGIVFLTVVTYGREGLFRDAAARRHLKAALGQVRAVRPWRMDGIVLLPDHLHMLWRLPEGDADYSTRVGEMKKTFTRAFLSDGGSERRVTGSQWRLGRRGVWQPRFWEHVIRDARDFRKHLDYIHINPVKHGLATRPWDWPWSTFRRYVAGGWYERQWSGPDDLATNVEYLWME